MKYNKIQETRSKAACLRGSGPLLLHCQPDSKGVVTLERLRVAALERTNVLAGPHVSDIHTNASGNTHVGKLRAQGEIERGGRTLGVSSARTQAAMQA